MRIATRLFFFFLILMVSAISFAQPLDYSTGGNLKRRQYQTYAAMTLYVDAALGSDANACTSSGAGACLTLGATLNKVPIHIRHLVTVNVAAGTYTEVFRVQGFVFAPANGTAATAGLTITGTQTAFTVATGSNTGTVSSYTNTSATDGAHAQINDGTQTWTVNNLRGRFVTVTAGPGNGEYHLITSNTATQLSLASPFTAAPTGASTYAIMTPGPVFTGSQGTVRNILGDGIVSITDISLQPASGTALNVRTVGALTQTRNRIVGVASGVLSSVASPAASFNWNIDTSYFVANTGTGLSLPMNTLIGATELFVQCTGTCTGAGVQTFQTNSTFTALTGTIAGSFATGLLRITGPFGGQSGGLWLDCSNSAHIGVYYPVGSDTNARFIGQGFAANAGPYINGCGVGFELDAPSFSYIDRSVYTNVTNAIVLSAGARAVIENLGTYTGVTNQLTIDGTVFTNADLTTFTRITGPQGSYATRP